MLPKIFNKKTDTKDVAMERLNKVILKDRTSYSAETMESLGADILSAIANYMEFDKNNTDIHISQSSTLNQPVLYVSVPIINIFNR